MDKLQVSSLVGIVCGHPRHQCRRDPRAFDACSVGVNDGALRIAAGYEERKDGAGSGVLLSVLCMESHFISRRVTRAELN
jgi:hypothetical protein